MSQEAIGGLTLDLSLDLEPVPSVTYEMAILRASSPPLFSLVKA